MQKFKYDVEQMYEEILKAKSGDDFAKQKLIEQFQPLISKLSKDKYGVVNKDFEQELKLIFLSNIGRFHIEI